jgi:hypothetical protein
VKQMVESTPMWWAPLLYGIDGNMNKWLELYMTSSHFCEWVDTYGRGDGSAVDAELLQEALQQTKQSHSHSRSR